MNTATTVDCRGQRCPAPILSTAKAARVLGTEGGGVLEIAADDDAFPIDIRSWCRSSGSELVDLRTGTDGVYKARVRVGLRPQAETVRDSGKAAGPELVRLLDPSANNDSLPSRSGSFETNPTPVLDFRGERCPAPILGLARQARTFGPGQAIEVVADDPAFHLDLESWCASASASVTWLQPRGDTLRARVRLGARDDQARTTDVSPPPASNTPDVIFLRGIPASQRLAELDRCVSLHRGEQVRVHCDDVGFSTDLVRWLGNTEHTLVSLDARGPLEAEIKLAPRDSSTTALAPVAPSTVIEAAEPRCTLLVLHNDREALLAALLVAVGSAAQGMKVMMFFTFWGLNLLRGEAINPEVPAEKISWVQRMFKWMMPRGPRRQKLGKLNMGGIGSAMLGSVMKRYELMDIPQLMSAAEEQGVEFVACTMSMQVMGITKRDIAPRRNLEYGGVAAFVESAGRSRVSLTF